MNEKIIDNNFKDGVLIETLYSWQEFHQKVSSLKSKRGFVWRGQKKDESGGWFLHSSFDREVQIKNQRDRDNALKNHLNNFKEAMNRSYPSLLPKDDIAVWALGQHYGLNTPLLDWTMSPYIAAYFAFKEEFDPKDINDSYRYVYALNRSIERLMSKLKKGNNLLSSDRSVPFIDQLPYPSPRFSVQQGIFTRAFQGNSIQKYVEKFTNKKPGKLIIVKFRIPTKDREECLHSLHLMNINRTSLLLDLSDAIEFCNNKLE